MKKEPFIDDKKNHKDEVSGENRYKFEPLRLTLQHFFVTYTLKPYEINQNDTCSTYAAVSQPVLLCCELHPLVAATFLDNVVDMTVYTLPLGLCERDNDSFLNTVTLSPDCLNEQKGSSDAINEISNKYNATVDNAEMDDIYRLGLILCSILRSRLLSENDFLEHCGDEHFQSHSLLGKANACCIPECFVDRSVLHSCLYPESLRVLTGECDQHEIATASFLSKQGDHHSYLTILFEISMVLKQSICLNVMKRQKYQNGKRSSLRMEKLFTTLNDSFVRSESTHDTELHDQESTSSWPITSVDDTRVFSTNFLTSLGTVLICEPEIFAFAVPIQESNDSRHVTAAVSFLLDSMLNVYQHRTISEGSLTSLWNFLLICWKCGLIRPSQAAQLLVFHQQQFPNFAPAIYADFYKELLWACNTDIELQRMFSNLHLSQVDIETWSESYICKQFTPVEALEINFLSIYIANGFDYDVDDDDDDDNYYASPFQLCIESNSSKIKIAYSTNLSGEFAKSSSLAYLSILKTNRTCHSPSYKRAICCVRPTLESVSSADTMTSIEVKSIWLKLDHDSTSIKVVDNTESLLLSVGEVLEIPIGNSTGLPTMLRPINSLNGNCGQYFDGTHVSVAMLFIEKLVWCSAIANATNEKHASETSSSGDLQVIISTTSQPLVLLVKGRWLYEDECYPSSFDGSIHESDAETIDIEDYKHPDLGHDSQSDFSEINASPAPLRIPYFLLQLDYVTTKTTGGGIVLSNSSHIVVRQTSLLKNINHDQIPSSVFPLNWVHDVEKMNSRGDDKTSTLLMILGSGGLAGIITMRRNELAFSIVNHMSIQHVSGDKYLRAINSEGKYAPDFNAHHSPDTAVTTASSRILYTLSLSPTCLKLLFVTGDRDGRVILWFLCDTNGGSAHIVKKIASLDLDGSVDQLHFVPSQVTDDDCVIFACTENRCYLLSSNITRWQDSFPNCQLYVKSVIDTGYCYSSSHASTVGHSLHPRYIVAYHDKTLFLWRLMRNKDCVTEIEISHRRLSLWKCDQRKPSFVYDSINPQKSASHWTMQPRDHDGHERRHVIQQLCHFIARGQQDVAHDLLTDQGLDVMSPLELISWKIVAGKEASIYDSNVGVRDSAVMRLATPIVKIFAVDCCELEAHLNRIRSVISLANSVDLQRTGGKFPVEKYGERTWASIPVKRFKDYHMQKLSQHHNREKEQTLHCETKSSSDIHESPKSSFYPIFPFVSASLSRNGTSDDESCCLDLIAYVHQSIDKQMGSKVQCVRLYERKKRTLLYEISGHTLVAELLPVLSFHSHDIGIKNENVVAECAAVGIHIRISALSFSSCGKFLVVAVSLSPKLSNIATPQCNVRMLDSPCVGLVIWCCSTRKPIGALLHDTSLIGFVESSSSVNGLCSGRKNAEQNHSRTAADGITTPPRPTRAVVSKPFGNTPSENGVRCHCPVDNLELFMEDTLLFAESRCGKRRIYSLSYLGAMSHFTDKECQQETKISDYCVLQSESDSLRSSHRYLMTGKDYLSLLSSPTLCTCFDYGSLDRCPAGRRVAELLLSALTSWLCVETTSKVFAIEGPQGSGKSDHLHRVVSSIIESDCESGQPSVHILSCKLPTPSTIVESACFPNDSTGSSNSVNVELLSQSSYEEIAYDMLMCLTQQLAQVLGDDYVDAVVKGLATELTLFMHMRKKVIGSSRSKLKNKNMNADSSNISPGDSFFSHRHIDRKSHVRQFSDASFSDLREDSSKSPFPSTSPESDCPTPPFLFPPFAVSSLHRPHRHSSDHQNVGFDVSSGEVNFDHSDTESKSLQHNDSQDFILFSELLCSTCIGIGTPSECDFMDQPTRTALLPHYELLPYLSLSRLFQLLISDPLRDIDLNNSRTSENVIIALDHTSFYDHCNQYNQVQAVMDMLLHCTPSWVRILLTSNNIFCGVTRPYLSGKAITLTNLSYNSITADGPIVTHFDMCVVRESAASVGLADGVYCAETAYQQDLNDSITNLISRYAMDHVLCKESNDSMEVCEQLDSFCSNATSFLDPYPVIDGNDAGDSIRDIFVMVKCIVDDSRQRLRLLESIFEELGRQGHFDCSFINVSLSRFLEMIDCNGLMLEGLLASTPTNEKQLIQRILEIVAAAYEPPPIKAMEDMLIAYASSNSEVHAKLHLLSTFLKVGISSSTCLPGGKVLSDELVEFTSDRTRIYARNHLSSLMLTGSTCINTDNPFDVNAARGHSFITALYLMHSSNKSIAVDHTWQNYLKRYGPSHLHRSSRLLHKLTAGVRKIDETSGLKGPLPLQLGYVAGLQEIYARRVGIYGPLPPTIGCLDHLRVLSMGNNKISGPIPTTLGNLHHLQRIVLHQNKLSGAVPKALSRLGCIVNLAGNPLLQHGDDVPPVEKQALLDLFHSTGGMHWVCNVGWVDSVAPVSQWYKVTMTRIRTLHALKHELR